MQLHSIWKRHYPVDFAKFLRTSFFYRTPLNDSFCTLFHFLTVPHFFFIIEFFSRNSKRLWKHVFIERFLCFSENKVTNHLTHQSYKYFVNSYDNEFKITERIENIEKKKK